MPVPPKVRSISTFKHKSGEFILAILYIRSFSCDRTKVYTNVKFELYLISGLKTIMLIDNDILYIKSFSINLVNTSTYIQSYGVDIIINAKYYAQYIKRKVLANITTFIPLKSKALVSFK